MSRSNYSDDYGSEFPGQLDLYRANVRRSLQSRTAQARLRELRDALLALPVKALAVGTFVDGTRDAPTVCALGAWALARCGGDPQAARALVPTEADDVRTAEALQPLGWPRLVVFEAVYENDEGDGLWQRETPEQRYARVLRWVELQMKGGGLGSD